MIHTCRHCDAHLSERFLDLGHAPLSNAYLDAAGLQAAEVTYPLRLNVCTACRLVQTEDYTSAADVFGADYAYFSSTSSGWVAHAKRYTDMIVERLDLGPDRACPASGWNPRLPPPMRHGPRGSRSSRISSAWLWLKLLQQKENPPI